MNNLSKEELDLLKSCVVEMRAILSTGLSQGLDAVNSKTQLGFHYESELDLKKDYRKLKALLRKFEPIKIHIAWGSSKYLDDVKEYTFDSEEEYLAFLKGVDESNGWLDYDTIGNHQCNWPNIEMWKRQYCPEEKSNG